MKAPELLAPAGTLKNLRYAISYGADAVYAGMPRYSLRVRNNSFSKLENIAEGIDLAHQKGKQFFLASNVLPHNSKVKTFVKDMDEVMALKPDALIMADPGLIMLAREQWPDVDIHLSVQANTMNFASVKFWQQIGIKRIILSRELSLEQIEEIRQECPDIELEVFVHGALCIAYSGRCLLSGYFNHRDANQGSCTNSCRWGYEVKSAEQNENGDVVHKQEAPSAVKDQVFLIEEANRPGEFMPVEEDEHGTYIMNSKDLRAVEHVMRLTSIGVDSLKIEGRTKSHYYVARTAQIYRQAIDDAVAGHEFDTSLLGTLENLANRGYTDGFLQRHHTHDYQNYMDSHSKSSKQRYVAEFTSYDETSGLAQFEVKNKFSVGDQLELILPEGNRMIELTEMSNLSGHSVSVAPGSGHQVQIPLPANQYTIGLLARNL
jgi:U32 family peptidase